MSHTLGTVMGWLGGCGTSQGCFSWADTQDAAFFPTLLPLRKTSPHLLGLLLALRIPTCDPGTLTFNSLPTEGDPPERPEPGIGRGTRCGSSFARPEPRPAEEQVPGSRLLSSAVQRVPLSEELLVHEPQGKGAHVCSPWQGGQRHPSFIHSLIPSTLPSLSTVVCPTLPLPSGQLQSSLVREEGVCCRGWGRGHRGYHGGLSGRGDIQQNLEGGVHLGFVQSLAELGTEFIGQGFGTTSPLASVD